MVTFTQQELQGEIMPLITNVPLLCFSSCPLRAGVLTNLLFTFLLRDHVDDPKPSSMGGVKLFFLLLLGVLGCICLLYTSDAADE